MPLLSVLQMGLSFPLSRVVFVTFDDGTNKEIVKVTAVNSNTLTVVRAQDGTSARSFSVGACDLRLTAKILETFPQFDGNHKQVSLT